jgi:hypothetical protein
MCYSDSQEGFGLDMGFIDHLQIVTTSNYDTLMELHTPNITVLQQSFLSSLVISW